MLPLAPSGFGGCCLLPLLLVEVVALSAFGGGDDCPCSPFLVVMVVVLVPSAGGRGRLCSIKWWCWLLPVPLAMGALGALGAMGTIDEKNQTNEKHLSEKFMPTNGLRYTANQQKENVSSLQQVATPCIHDHLIPPEDYCDL